MAVLLISAEYPPMQGGVGDYTRLLALALRNQGWEVSVLTSAGAAGRPGDPLAVYPLVRRWSWGALLAIAQALRRQRPAIVHLQYQTGAYHMHPAIHFLPDLLRRLASPPRLVVTMHDLRLPYLFPKAGRLRQWAVAHLLCGADAVVVTNSRDLGTLALSPEPAAGGQGKRERVDPDLLRPLPAGSLRRPPALIPLASSLPAKLPEYDRPAWRECLGVAPQESLLGHFGLLHPSKGADLLVAALAGLRRAGRTVRLLMVGGGSRATDPGNAPFAAALRQEIAHRGLAEVVHWTGYCPEEEAAAHLRACDLVVLPFRDGASFRRSSLVAVLALGCAVVTTQPLDPAEVSLGAGQPALADGENAALAPPGDTAALEGALAALLDDAGRRARLGEGAARLGESFRWEEVARRTVELYGQLPQAN